MYFVEIFSEHFFLHALKMTTKEAAPSPFLPAGQTLSATYETSYLQVLSSIDESVNCYLFPHFQCGLDEFWCLFALYIDDWLPPYL